MLTMLASIEVKYAVEFVDMTVFLLFLIYQIKISLSIFSVKSKTLSGMLSLLSINF